MKNLTLLTCALLFATTQANAQTSPTIAMPKPASATPADGSVMTEGVVQAVDASNGVVTLKHGDIVHMQMPAMTMAYNVADKKMLVNVKSGEKVRFHVENVKGSPTVTRIEAAR